MSDKNAVRQRIRDALKAPIPEAVRQGSVQRSIAFKEWAFRASKAIIGPGRIDDMQKCLSDYVALCATEERK